MLRGCAARLRRRLSPAWLGLLVTLAWLTAQAPPVAAATVTFGTPTASPTFGQGVAFRQPVTVDGSIRRVELLLEYPQSPGPEVRVVDAGVDPTLLQYRLDTTTRHLLPNTTLTARWRVIGDDGSVSVGPSVSTRYQDTRFAWQTRQAGLVRVHWYDGGPELASRALEIGTGAMDSAGRLLGVSEVEPIDFFIYGSESAFYDALGPGTRENVGGQANAEIRTLFALISPDDRSSPWVDTVVSHELTHLVFDSATSNPYHFPPRWLNEGLAMYLTEGFRPSDRAEVERAAAEGALMPLPALADQFPTTRERFSLAYAESVAAVDYLVRTHGEQTLVGLVRSYASGVTDDEAFQAALGLDVPGFDASWRASLQAREPVVYGPRPDKAGPLPAGWNVGPTITSPPASSLAGRDGAEATGLVAVVIAAAALVIVGLGLLWRARAPGFGRSGGQATPVADSAAAPAAGAGVGSGHEPDGRRTGGKDPSSEDTSSGAGR